MAGAGDGPYSHLHVGLMLKHFKSGRCGVVLGWGDHNGVPYLHLYFADREPADKNMDRSKCYEWRRVSVFVPMNQPLVTPPGDAIVAMQHEPGPEPAKSESTVEVDVLKADDKSLADDDFIMVDKTPKEEVKEEALAMHRMDNMEE